MCDLIVATLVVEGCNQKGLANGMKHWQVKLLLPLAAWLTVSAQAALPIEKESARQIPGRSQARLPVGSRLHDYDEIVSPDMESASSLANRARVSLKNGNYTRAVDLAKKAVEKDDDDPDAHTIFAQSIEAKLEHQTEKDPALFKTCVREWLTVYRNETGEEKGMTIKGINIMGTFWNDDFRGNLAKKHLKKLTGYLPKAWETDNRYIARVVRPAKMKVTGVVKQ